MSQQLLAINQNIKFAAVVAIQLILTMIKAGRQEDATSPAAFLYFNHLVFQSVSFSILRCSNDPYWGL